MKRMNIALAWALAIASTPSQAQDSRPGRNAFTGDWIHTADSAEQQQRDAAIEAVTEGMPFFIRGSARERLLARTSPAPELRLAVVDDRFELTRGGDKYSLTLGARPVTLERDGRRGKVSARLDDQQIVVVSEGEKGERVTTYTLSPDRQSLTLSVRMTGKRLPAPLSFRTTYHRKASGPVDRGQASRSR